MTTRDLFPASTSTESLALPSVDTMWSRVLSRGRRTTAGLMTRDEVELFLFGVAHVVRKAHEAMVSPMLITGRIEARAYGSAHDRLYFRDGQVRYARHGGGFGGARRPFPFCGIAPGDGIGLVEQEVTDPDTGKKKLWRPDIEAIVAAGWFARGGVWYPPTTAHDVGRDLVDGMKIVAPPAPKGQRRAIMEAERHERVLAHYRRFGIEPPAFIVEKRELRDGESAVVVDHAGTVRTIRRGAGYMRDQPDVEIEGEPRVIGQGLRDIVAVAHGAVVLDDDPDVEPRDDDDPAPWAGDNNDGTEGGN